MKHTFPTFDYENPHYQKGREVVGIDEVGRGALAGPLVVGAVIFPFVSESNQKDLLSLGIQDSKLLSAHRREILAIEIKNRASFWAIASTTPQEINTLGISRCLSRAVTELMIKTQKYCSNNQISFLIDGLPISHIPYNHLLACEFIIKGDMKCISIAAASILAKVERDTYMSEVSKKYPRYEWQINKGYGTEKHRDALKQYGPTDHHRDLYIRNIIKNEP
jgi:ribonuclease HII